MSAASEAYEVAETMIAQALAQGAADLDFNIEATHALEALPPQIGELTGLGTLSLNKTQVSNLSPLAGLTGLSTLWLNNTQVSDVSLLAGLTRLSTLWLANTPVSDLSPLAGLTGLGWLDLPDTPVSDLSPLAGLTGLRVLTLSNSQVSDLSPLARLTRLRTLYIDNTQVSDLSPLVGLTGLDSLDLYNTQVRDLLPIKGLVNLIPGDDDRSGSGLRFANTPAAKQDPDLRALSEIENDKERTEKTLAYLAEVAEVEPAAPEQQGRPNIVVRDNKIDVDQLTPDQQEVDDPVKQKALQRLRDAAERLIRSGNQFPDVYEVGTALKRLIEVPLGDLDLVEVHIELEICRGIYNRRSERTGENILSSDVTSAFERLAIVGPGLTMDNADVEVFEARRRNYIDPPVGSSDLQNRNIISSAIQNDDALFRENIRRISVELQKGSLQNIDRLKSGQSDLVRNTVIYVGATVVGGMLSGPLGSLGMNAVEWLAANAETIRALATGWGEPFTAWIVPILEDAKKAQAAAQHALTKKRK